MAGEIVHLEIPADDTAASREFWGSLFGWQFEAYPGPFEYHMTRISDQAGLAITNMEPGKRGTRAYFDVDDINAGAARVRELGGEADEPGPTGERIRPLADRSIRPGTSGVARVTAGPPSTSASFRGAHGSSEAVVI